MLAVVVALELRRRHEGQQPRQLATVLKKPLAIAMRGMLLILPTVSQRVCNSFRCIPYAYAANQEIRLLAIDLRVDCSSAHYQRFTSYAGVMVFGE